jgi:hypothetical protein
VYLYWIVTPTFSAAHFTIHWLDIAMPVFLGGVWIAVFIGMLRRHMARQQVVAVQGAD